MTQSSNYFVIKEELLQKWPKGKCPPAVSVDIKQISFYALGSIKSASTSISCTRCVSNIYFLTLLDKSALTPCGWD